MSLNLSNIAETIHNSSNQNVVDSNILKLDRKLQSIQAESRKLQDEKTRLRRLKKSIEHDKQQLRTQKTAIQNQQEMIRHQMAKTKSAQLMVTEANLEQRKEHKNLQKTLSHISKELTATKRKLMSEQRKGQGDKEKKLKAMQRRYEAEKKNHKLMKRELDSVLGELAITKRKLMTAQRKGGKGGLSNAKYKSLLRKWMKERKKLKLALMEFEDRANFHRRQIANFKKQQTKWLRQQKSTSKGKKHAVKYVFMDDMVAIKINPKYKDRVKIVTSKGKEILVPRVRVIMEKGARNKKKKGKKGKKGGKHKSNAFVDEDPSWMEQDQMIQQLLDDNEFESSFFQQEQEQEQETEEEDYICGLDELELIRGDVMEWKEEMSQRNEDLAILMSIAMNYSRDADRSEHLNYDELMNGIVERNTQRFEEMEDEEIDEEMDALPKRKNAYEESTKLLAEECDEYVHSLQNAISSIQSIVESNRVSKPSNRLSLVPQKTAAESGQSLLSLSADSLSLCNPYTIADELSGFYMEELDARTKDIEMMLEIFTARAIYYKGNDATRVHLDDIVRGIDARMDEVEDTDELVVRFIGNMENWKTHVQEYAMRMALLLRELSERREEVKQMFDVIDISEGNQALVNRIQTLSEKIEIRHESVPQIMDHSRYEAILGGNGKGSSGSEAEEEEKEEIDMDVVKILENVAGFQHENEEWSDLMAQLAAEANKHSKETWKSSKKSYKTVVSSKIVENSVHRSMKEIDCRIEDVEQLKLVLLSRDSETAGELLNAIEDRHTVLNESNDDIIKSHSHCAQYCVSEQNNSLWWKVIEDIVLNNKIMKKKRGKKEKAGHAKAYESASLSLMRPTVATPLTPVTPQRKGTIRGVDYNENLKFVLSRTAATVTTTQQNDGESKLDPDTTDEFDDEGWWLMLDESRNTLIDSLALEATTATKDVICKLAVYVSRILKSETDRVTKLYVPIDLSAYPSSAFRALATLFDGVLIAKLLCLINEDYIDFRGIHQPNSSDINAYPLREHEINENISVILSSLKSMGIGLAGDVVYTVKDWWNPDKHCDLLMKILREIASHSIDRFCSYKKHGELLLLAKKTETYATLLSFNGEKWIIRWINYLLKRHGPHNASIDDDDVVKLNKDLMRILTLLKKRSSVLLNKPNATKLDNAKAFIKIAKTSFNVSTPMEAQDFTSNNRFCQMYFAAQIFDKMNGLSLPQDMNINYNADIDEGFDEGEKESIMAWLNSFGLRNHVDSLDDITSGVILLRVLDRLKQGAVSWKKVHLKVRHKFDHVVNCNYVVDICCKQLGLRFVNISGMDIVNKNTQIIKSILWRIMRYQSIKILSDLQFGSNISRVNNGVIMKWCNEKVHPHCKAIKKLKDASLTTGMYYLELIRAVMPNAIDDALIHKKLAPLSSAIKKDFHLHDKHYKKRKQNLKYAMTIIRRYGVDLFINVDDLFRLESRAVLSILAALMTISLSTSQIAKNKNAANCSKQAAIQQLQPAKSKNDPSSLNMEHVDDIDIDGILDDVDSLYKK